MKTVLVVREFGKFSESLTARGFKVINLPMIKTLPIENFDELDAKLEILETYDGLFLTSPRAAEVFLQKFAAKSFGGKIYVLGNRTKTLFESKNFETVFVPDANTAEDLIEAFRVEEFAGKKFLFLRGDKSLRKIFDLLRSVAEIDEIIVYRTIEISVDEQLCDEINGDFRHQNIHCIAFFSPSGVESFVGAFDKSLLKSTKFAAIGTTTAKKLADENLPVDLVASKATAQDFAAELIEYLGRNLTAD